MNIYYHLDTRNTFPELFADSEVFEFGKSISPKYALILNQLRDGNNNSNNLVVLNEIEQNFLGNELVKYLHLISVDYFRRMKSI